MDLPSNILRAAKARAAERGESLKDLINRAVAHEVSFPADRGDDTRVVLPLVGSRGRLRVDVTNADIEASLAADDADRYGSQCRS